MKKILAFAMAAVLALGLAACGGSGTSAASVSTAPAPSAAATSAASGTDASAAGETSIVDEIQTKGVLTMMTATGFPPFEYLGEDGKPAGVDIDLAQLVADELGVELEVLDMDFNLLIESLKSGKGQLIAAGMTATPERAEQIDFSVTYTMNGLILLVPKGSDIKTAEDLAGKNIAVQESTTAHIYAQEELGIEPMAFKNANECATAIMGGKADAAILDKVPAQTLALANPDALETVDELLTEEEMAMGIAKGNDALLEVVNKVLQKAMDDGTVEKLTNKHLEICAEG